MANPISTEVWYCKDFPFQESMNPNDKKTRPVLILEQISKDRFMVMMLTTGKRHTKYDVPITNNDIIEGKTKDKSRARVFIVRYVYRNQLTNKIFKVKKQFLIKVSEMLNKFDNERYNSPENFRDFCTLINFEKITDVKDHVIRSIEDIEESRTITGIEVALIVNDICKENNINSKLAYIVWKTRLGKVGHLLESFIDKKGNVSTFHYLGKGYCAINDSKISDFNIGINRTIAKYEDEINMKGKRELDGWKLFTDDEMDRINKLNCVGMPIEEFFRLFIGHDIPVVLEAVELPRFFEKLEVVDD